MSRNLVSKVLMSYAALCAQALRTILARPDRDQAGPANRERLVLVLEQALARRARRVVRARRLTQAGALAVAAGVVLAFGWIWWGASGTKERRLALGQRVDRPLTVLGAPAADGAATAGLVVVAGEATRRPLKDGMTLEPGTGLVAPATNEVRIGTSDGTVLTLERGGELTVVEQDTLQRYSLRRGAVRARVSKLHGEERFIITTEDAEIEVHGTSFRIAMVDGDPACGAGVRTRVTVSEGVVSVRAANEEALVPAGGAWPRGCAAPVAAIAAADKGTSVPPPAQAAPPARVAHLTRRVSAARVAAPPPTVVTPAEESVLAAQNDLFQAAIRAKRQQRPAESVRLLSQLIDKYPSGPLAEGAMVQRFQVLGLIDKEGAVRAARAYLSRFPAGYARAEARELAGSGS